MPVEAEFNATKSQLEEIEVIEQSGMFDADWYMQSNADLANASMSGIVHYVRFGAREGRNPSRHFDTKEYFKSKKHELKDGQNPFAHYIMAGTPDEDFKFGMMTAFSASSLRRGTRLLAEFPLFDDADYLQLNSDLRKSNMAPAAHAFLYGFAEGRRIFGKMRMARELGRVSKCEPVPPRLPPAEAIPATVGVYYNTTGNGFIKELAADLTSSLTRAGVDAYLLTELSSKDNRPALPIIMGPHEFFHLNEGQSWACEKIVSTAYMFNTEQPQTIWFERGAPFILMSKGVIDICHQIAELFRSSGLPALHYHPDVVLNASWLEGKDMRHPLVRVLPRPAQSNPKASVSFSNRPIDISFFGGSSAHRDAFFTRHAAFLADYENFIYYRRFDGPMSNSDRDDVLPRLAGHVSAHSKISLNIHRDEHCFFEWHRIVKLAMAGGSVVVTEPCLPHPVLKPNQHFFEETSRQMPNLLEWLLRSPEGQVQAEQVRQNALSWVQNRDEAAASAEQLKSFISRRGNFR